MSIRRNNRNRLNGMERLQDRQLMAGDVELLTPQITVHGPSDTATIEGTVYSDSATVSYNNNGTDDPQDDKLVISVTTNGQTHRKVLNKFDWRGNPNVEKLVFHGGRSNDKIFNFTDIDMEAYGGLGNDMLRGGSGNDVLDGGDHSDTLIGGLGENWLYGGKHNDALFGGDEVDHIYGESGDDWIVGNGGNDGIRGMTGNDIIYGNSGDDWIDAGSGDDDVHGGDGRDEIFGQSGRDYIHGGNDNDLIIGGSGSDWLYGDRGNDTILGDSGEDKIWGGRGHDFLYGGDQDDIMYGGAGDDVMFGGDGEDRVDGQAGNDVLFGGELDGLEVRHANYGAPEYSISSGQDWEKDDLIGGSGTDKFYILNNTWFTRDDRAWDSDSDSIVIDWDGADSWGYDWDTTGLFPVDFWEQFGHLRD